MNSVEGLMMSNKDDDESFEGVSFFLDGDLLPALDDVSNRGVPIIAYSLFSWEVHPTAMAAKFSSP